MPRPTRKTTTNASCLSALASSRVRRGLVKKFWYNFWRISVTYRIVQPHAHSFRPGTLQPKEASVTARVLDLRPFLTGGYSRPPQRGARLIAPRKRDAPGHAARSGDA